MKRSLKPLTQDDPDEVWAPRAAALGLTVADLREQVRLADAIMEEIIAEEITEKAAAKKAGPSSALDADSLEDYDRLLGRV